MQALLIGVLAVAAACGGGGGEDPDAGPPDAGGNLHVQVTLDGVPNAGIHVLLHDSAGGVEAQEITGTSGLVHFTAPEFPAVVTVADPAVVRLLTTGGIGEGETITFPFLSDPTVTEARNVDVVLPGVFAGADLYILHWGLCDTWEPVSNPSVATTIAVAEGCLDPDGTLSAVAYAFTGATLSAFAAGTGPSTAPLTLNGWDTDWTYLPGTMGGYGGVEVYLAGGAFEFQGFGNELLPVPPIATAGYQVWVSAPSGTTGTGQVDVYWTDPQLPPSLILPAGDFLAPGDAPLAVDFKRHPIISWSASPDLAEADAARIWLVWSTGGIRIEWVVTLPPDALTFQFPELPDELAALRYPGGPPTTLVQGYVDVDTVDGYDAWRAAFGADMILPPPPAAWRYRVGTQRP